MSNVAQQANTQRVALIIGAIDLPDAIRWADSQIEASDVPHNCLIDISLGRSKPAAAIASLLADVAGHISDCNSIKSAFGLMADRIRRKQIDAQTAIMNCFHFLQAEHLLYADDFMIFINLEDDLSLIRDGIFSLDKMSKVEADLLEALDEMAAISYTRDNNTLDRNGDQPAH